MTQRRYQFSLPSFLAFVTVYAAASAAIVQIPHVAVLVLGLTCAALVSRAAYRSIRRGRPRISLVLVSLAAWAICSILSVGPFIVLSEVERKISGRYHLASLGSGYYPVLLVYGFMRPFRWYVNKWIPADAVGLQATDPDSDFRPLVGTWRGEMGNVIDFRPDGTARCRHVSDEDISYFEWTCKSGQLATYQYSSKCSLPAWFGRDVLNYGPTDLKDVVGLTDTAFRLRGKTGKTYSYTRVVGTGLESAP